MLQEILQKESINDDDMKVIMAHYSELSDADLVRLGFKTAEPSQVEEPEKVEAPKPKRKKVV
jgi:hypothetical protein